MLLSYLFISNAYAKENDINELNAQIWLTEFNKLLINKKWLQAKYAFDLAEKKFSKTKYWSDENVKRNVNYFKYNYAASNWKAGSNNNSYWLVSDTNNQVGAGLQQDPQGNVWLVFSSKEKSLECDRSCTVFFKEGDKIHSVLFKQSNNTIGAMVPKVLLNNREQHIEVNLPNNTIEKFDFSYLPYVIRSNFRVN